MSARLGISLPESWSWKPLKFLTTYLNRGTAPDYMDDGPIRAVSQAVNQSNGLAWERARFHFHQGNPRRLKGYLSPQDVLINSTGTGTLGRVGYFVRSPDGRPCIADSHVTIARADRHVLEPRFLYYWLGSIPFYDYIYSALTVGATNQIELNREGLAAAPAIVPPLDEQRRIVDFLDAETASIDHLVRQRTRQRHVLIELVLSSIDDIVGRLTENPQVRLGYLAFVQTGVTVDGGRKDSAVTVTLPYLRVANVQAGYVNLGTVTEITVPREMAAASRLHAGDVLMTEGGDLDKLGRGTVWNGEIRDCLHQNHVFAVRPNPRVLSAEYLAVLTRAPMARKYFESTGSKTTNLASTSSSKIRDFRVPLPSVDVQEAVVKEIHSRLDGISRLDAQLTRQLDLLAERRRALITAAVTGQIDVAAAQGVAV